MTSVTLQEILADKTIKAKTKTEMISNLLLSGKIGMQELVTLAGDSKDPAKATCIEALEFASRQQPDVVNLKTFQFVVQSLASKAPRVKWESAKVIGNTVRLFPDKLDDAIKNLLDNTESDGTEIGRAHV